MENESAMLREKLQEYELYLLQAYKLLSTAASKQYISEFLNILESRGVSRDLLMNEDDIIRRYEDGKKKEKLQNENAERKNGDRGVCKQAHIRKSSQAV